MIMYLYKEIIEYHNGNIKEIIPAWWTNRIFKSIRSVGAIYINGVELKHQGSENRLQDLLRMLLAFGLREDFQDHSFFIDHKSGTQHPHIFMPE